MRFLAAALLLVLLGGAALGFELSGTVPAAQAACPDSSATGAPRMLADVYRAPERFELAFHLENPGPDNMTWRPPREWSVAYYEVRPLGRLAPLHTTESHNDFVDDTYPGHDVPPGEPAWIGGDSFTPPQGAPASRTYLALVTVESGEHCGLFEFSRASAQTF